MKRISLSSLPVIFMMALAMFITSCEKDPCNDVDCGANGDCFDGTCICDTGYEGTNCETLSRAKIIGSYQVTEDCSQSAATSYNMTITAGTNPQDIRITGLWEQFNNAINATVDGNTISIPSQDPDSDGYVISGTLNFNPTTEVVTGTYSVTGGGATDVCSDTKWTQL